MAPREGRIHAIKRLARFTVGRSYVVSKRYAQWRLRRGSGPRRLVFSMGKTGSTAVARAIADATGTHVFQVFRLEPVQLAAAEDRYRVLNRHAKREGRDVSPLAFP